MLCTYSIIGDDMDDLEKLKQRIQKKKHGKTLGDRSFKKLYNTMIKIMVLLVVGLLVLTYTKQFPNASLRTTLLDNENFIVARNWVETNLLSFFIEEPVEVVNQITYTSLGNDMFSSSTNEVVSFQQGRVIEVENHDDGTFSISILQENQVVVKYDGLQNILTSLYDYVDSGAIIATYDNQLKITFEYVGKMISYEEYMGME